MVSLTFADARQERRSLDPRFGSMRIPLQGPKAQGHPLGMAMLQNQPARHHGGPDVSEVETALAGGIGERLDAPVIHVATAVEDTSLVTPACLARSAMSLPTAFAASMSAPVFKVPRRSFSSDEAAAMVTPFASSMTWA